MQVAQLTYRLFEDKDLPAILSLWENFSGWGGITEQQFYDWYVNTPDGRCLVIVAENNANEVVGQLVFVPAKVCLNGKELKALRLSAPILHRDFRHADLRSIEHPAFGMVRTGIDLAREMGYHILYCLPAHGWMALMRLLPHFGMPAIQMASYECAAISLNDEMIWNETKTVNNTISSKVTNSFDESYDRLWMESVKMFPPSCSIIRNSLRLQWKISHHLVIEVRDTDKLLGYAAYKENERLLVDILARNPEEMKMVLLASIKAMHSKNENRLPVSFEEIKFMLSPRIIPLLQEINYYPVNFQFAFSCYPLNASIDKNSIHPDKWHIMPDD